MPSLEKKTPEYSTDSDSSANILAERRVRYNILRRIRRISMPMPGGARGCERILKSGARCKNPALKEFNFCRMHAPTIVKLEKERPLFGKGSHKLVLPIKADQELFESVLAGLQAEFTLNNSSDMINLEMLATYYVKWRRAVEAGNDKLAASFDGLVQRNLAALQVTRSTRPTGESTFRSPADISADIMTKAAEYEKSEEAARLAEAETDKPADKKKPKKKKHESEK